MAATCPQCRATWGGHRTEHCSVCHETFSGTAAGDKHRVGDHNDGTRHCAWPADRGLVLRERWGYKVWGFALRGERPATWNQSSS